MHFQSILKTLPSSENGPTIPKNTNTKYNKFKPQRKNCRQDLASNINVHQHIWKTGKKTLNYSKWNEKEVGVVMHKMTYLQKVLDLL